MDSLLPYSNLADASEAERLDALAADIWRAVVSEHLPKVRHYAHWVASRPAKRVGGDFQMAADNWIAVGDVSGKGVPAALLTGMFVAAFKLAVRTANPAKALEHALFTELESANMFTTLAAAELGEDGWLNYLNLGHPPILVRRLNGQVEHLSASAPPIGTFRMDTYPLANTRLLPGESVCLYTDGIIEAQKHDGQQAEMYGIERLSTLFASIESPKAAFDAILKDLETWTLDDDLTLLVFQYSPERDWRDSHLDRR